MRWFFLSLLVPFAFFGEMLILEPNTGSHPYIRVDRVPSAIAYLVFCLSLFVYWWSSYFSPPDTRERGLQMGHGLMKMSLGVYLGLSGIAVILSRTCTYVPPTGGGKSAWSEVIAALTQDVEQHGLCTELGYLCLLIGAGLTWPTLRLFSSGRNYCRLD